jgi:hypothetical protein
MIDLRSDTAHSTGKRGWERQRAVVAKGAAFTIGQIGGMTVSISLKREVWRLLQKGNSSRDPAMEKQTGDLTMFRYELVHGDDADFIAYQRQLGDGVWQTLSRWMIPGRTVATSGRRPRRGCRRRRADSFESRSCRRRLEDPRLPWSLLRRWHLNPPCEM